MKLATTTSSNTSQQRRTSKAASIISTSGDSHQEAGGASRSSAAFAVKIKMAEMYSKIGRTEETVQLVEGDIECVERFKKYWSY